MRRTPALIVGGGPAGAVAALLLARAGADHLLVERQRETGDALCGGFLSWRTLETLGALGIAADMLNPARVTHLRLFAGRVVARAALPRPALAVSRRRLDSILLDAAEKAGARVERGVGARGLDGAAVRLSDGADLTADALFLATGKHDLRGAARPVAARGEDPALGLRVRLPASPGLARMIGDAIELHMVDRGYAGLVLQEDGSANLCMAIRRSRLAEAGDVERLFDQLAAELAPLGERLAYRDGAPVKAIANVPYGWRAEGGVTGLFRLGDQAGVIPSLAGEGMGIAIASGVRAVRAYLDGGPAGAVDYQRALAAALARPMAVAGAIRHAAESPRVAPWLARAAQLAPPLAGIAARMTRISHSAIDAAADRGKSFATMDQYILSESEWRKKLTPEQYHVLREAGTERAFTGRYNDNKADGIYRCAGCGQELFDSADKYDSGSGWPSFTQPISADYVSEHGDHSHGMSRVEARCARCDGHLGHVFPDGPPPTGLRYCMNSVSLDFKPR